MSVFRKLNLKDQSEILVVDAPPSFEPEIAALDGVTVHRNPDEAGGISFALLFVTTLSQIAAATEAILPRAEGDAVVWFAYPKQSSKRYRCEFNRDTGWEPLGAAGFEGVRQVAIDEDLSALRFRGVEFIRKMTRDASLARTERGKARVAKGEE